MLTVKFWVGASLVNRSLGKVITIIYNLNNQLPTLQYFVVIEFLHYKGPPCDASNQNFVSIPPITRGSHRKVPLHMAWGLTIHKAQGMTLQNATIDIGNIDRKGLTFTAISRLKYLSSLCIYRSFSFYRYSRMKNNPYVQRRNKSKHCLLQSHCKHIVLKGCIFLF